MKSPKKHNCPCCFKTVSMRVFSKSLWQCPKCHKTFDPAECIEVKPIEEKTGRLFDDGQKI